MANIRSYRATGTIRVSRFVTPSADSSVAESNSGDLPVGISQQGGRAAPVPANTTSPVEAAIAGDQLNVFSEGEFCLLTLGVGGCTAGALLKSDNDGQGVALAGTAGTREFYGARAIEAGTAGTLVRVQVLTGSQTVPV